MEVLLTGATGYIGTAVAEALRAAGHGVTGLARSDEAARKLEERGVKVHRGDMAQPETVAAAARLADGVIHTALPHTPDAPTLDRGLVEAVIEALAGSGKPFLYTSGVWVYGRTGDRIAVEDTPLAPIPLVAWRPAHEQLVVAAAGRGVRGLVIRPAMVYGRQGGLTMSFYQSARERGAARVVGDGNNRWTFVHVDDLADLYVRLLDAKAGTVLVAASGTAIRVRRVAEAASRAAGAAGRVEYWPLEEARQELGPFADALALDQQISASKAQRLLGWRPHAPTVLDEFARAAATP